MFDYHRIMVLVAKRRLIDLKYLEFCSDKRNNVNLYTFNLKFAAVDAFYSKE